MRIIGAILFVILLAISVIALAGGLTVLLAYGIGWILAQFLPFSYFEATLLGLAGMAAGVMLVSNLYRVFSDFPSLSGDDDEDDWDDDDWDEDDDDLLDEDEGVSSDDQPGVPRWRQSSRPIRIPKVAPDERCPCGSGKKYKNCHGRKNG
ncbi:MAG: SEC-C domain-containing protein [Chloroflexi bacterium]|nr:SEC-C domain-containing protein [Chloroflexota bacterium]